MSQRFLLNNIQNELTIQQEQLDVLVNQQGNFTQPYPSNIILLDTDLQGVNSIQGFGGANVSFTNDINLTEHSINNCNQITTQSIQDLGSIKNTLNETLNIEYDGATIQRITMDDGGIRMTADVLNRNSVLLYDNVGNLLFQNGGQNIDNNLGTTTSKNIVLTQGSGGSITFADGSVQSTAGGGGGGGSMNNPSTAILDMAGFDIENVNSLYSQNNSNFNISNLDDTGASVNAVLLDNNGVSITTNGTNINPNTLVYDVAGNLNLNGGGQRINHIQELNSQTGYLTTISGFSQIIMDDNGTGDAFGILRNIAEISTIQSGVMTQSISFLGNTMNFNGNDINNINNVNTNNVNLTSGLTFTATDFQHPQTLPYLNQDIQTLTSTDNTITITQNGTDTHSFNLAGNNFSTPSNQNLDMNSNEILNVFTLNGDNMNDLTISNKTNTNINTREGDLDLWTNNTGYENGTGYTTELLLDQVGCNFNIYDNVASQFNIAYSASLDTTGNFNVPSLVLKQGGGGSIKFADGSVQSTAGGGGGGGTMFNPSVADLDMANFQIIQSNDIYFSANPIPAHIGTNTIINSLTLEVDGIQDPNTQDFISGNIVLSNIQQLGTNPNSCSLTLENNGTLTLVSGNELPNIKNEEGTTTSKNFELTQGSGGSIKFQDGTTQNTAPTMFNPSIADLDMDTYNITNVSNINTTNINGSAYPPAPVWNGEATSNLNMNGYAIQQVGQLYSVSGILSLPNQEITLNAVDNNGLSQSFVGVASEVGVELCSMFQTLNQRMTYDNNGDVLFHNGSQNIYNTLGTTTSKNFELTQGSGGSITFEDGTIQTTASTSGGGNFSTPSDQNLDMNENSIINVPTITSDNYISLIAHDNIQIYSKTNNDINLFNNYDGRNTTETGITNEISIKNDGITLASYDNTNGKLPKNTLTYDNNNNLTFAGTDEGTINNVNNIITSSGYSYIATPNTNDNLEIYTNNNTYSTDGYCGIFLDSTNKQIVLNVDTGTNGNYNRLLLDNSGNLTFSTPRGVAGQNITNELGKTTSKSLELTQGGNGSIKFQDGSEMATAGGNMFNPSIANLDMDSYEIQNIKKLYGDNNETLVIQNVNNDINLNVYDNTALKRQLQLSQLNGFLVGFDNNKSITYDPNGSLTFEGNGDENITNENGITKSQSFIITRNGGGSIKFADGTEQTTAGGGGGGGNFSTPSNQNLDMNTHDILQVGNINLSTINQTAYPPPSSWVGTATSDLNMNTHSITNLVNINGSSYPPASTFVSTATGNLNMATFDINNVNNINTTNINDIQARPSNTYWVNEGANYIEDVLPNMSVGDVCYISSGSFSRTSTNLVINKTNVGIIAPNVHPAITEFIYNSITIQGTQTRISNLQLDANVISTASYSRFDDCDFQKNATFTPSGYLTINNCEFIGTGFTLTIPYFTTASAVLFTNCNFSNITFVLNNPSPLQVYFNNCIGFGASFPTNATYVGINSKADLSTTTTTNNLILTQNAGGTIKFADGTIQSTASSGGGGGGNMFNPSIANLSMSNFDITNVNDIHLTTINGSAYPPASSWVGTATSDLNMNTHSITNLINVNGSAYPPASTFVGTATGNLNMANNNINNVNTLGIKSGGDIVFATDSSIQTTAYQNLDIQTLTSTNSSITITQNGSNVHSYNIEAVGGGGGGNFSTPSSVNLDMDSHNILQVGNINLSTINLAPYPPPSTWVDQATSDLDMGGYRIQNAQYIAECNGLSGRPNYEININAPDIDGLTQSFLNVSVDTGVSMCSKFQTLNQRMFYNNNGDITFQNGSQNISNTLGTTTSKNFELTQGAGGSIKFADGTTQSTAGGGGGGGNFSTPSSVNLDMNTHNILQVGNINLSTINSSAYPPASTFVGTATSDLNMATFDITNATNITNTGLTTSNGFELTQSGSGHIKFADGTIQSTASTGGGGGGNMNNPSTANLNMASYEITNVKEIKGDNTDDLVIINNTNIKSYTGTGSYKIWTNQTGAINDTGYKTELLLDNTSCNFNVYDNTIDPNVVKYSANLDANSGYFNVDKLGVNSSGNIGFTTDNTFQTTAYQNKDIQTLTSTNNSITITQNGSNVHSFNIEAVGGGGGGGNFSTPSSVNLDMAHNEIINVSQINNDADTTDYLNVYGSAVNVITNNDTAIDIWTNNNGYNASTGQTNEILIDDTGIAFNFYDNTTSGGSISHSIKIDNGGNISNIQEIDFVSSGGGVINLNGGKLTNYAAGKDLNIYTEPAGTIGQHSQINIDNRNDIGNINIWQNGGDVVWSNDTSTDNNIQISSVDKVVVQNTRGFGIHLLDAVNTTAQQNNTQSDLLLQNGAIVLTANQNISFPYYLDPNATILTLTSDGNLNLTTTNSTGRQPPVFNNLLGVNNCKSVVLTSGGNLTFPDGTIQYTKALNTNITSTENTLVITSSNLTTAPTFNVYNPYGWNIWTYTAYNDQSSLQDWYVYGGGENYAISIFRQVGGINYVGINYPQESQNLTGGRYKFEITLNYTIQTNSASTTFVDLVYGWNNDDYNDNNFRSYFFIPAGMSGYKGTHTFFAYFNITDTSPSAYVDRNLSGLIWNDAGNNSTIELTLEFGSMVAVSYLQAFQ